MPKVLIEKISEYVTLYRDSKTGIAMVEDYSSGNGHSAHPNIDASGSIRGMKNRGYWGKSDRVVRSAGYLHNIDRVVITSEYDQIANDHCQCGGKHAPKKEQN